MLTVSTLSILTISALSVILLSVNMVSVVMQNDVMLLLMTPKKEDLRARIKNTKLCHR
jgi:hypothetical protein